MYIVTFLIERLLGHITNKKIPSLSGNTHVLLRKVEIFSILHKYNCVVFRDRDDMRPTKKNLGFLKGWNAKYKVAYKDKTLYIW